MPEETEPEFIDLATLKDTPVLKTDERRLSVRLTDDEWTERVEQQDERWATMRDLKDAEDSHRRVFNTAHKAREATFDDGQRVVKAKAEHRQVEIKLFALLEPNLCITVRTDTGEVVESRPLTGKELDKLAQQPLPLPLPPEAEASPMPKGVRKLAAYIKAGHADDKLNALDADSRKGVEDAVAARREVLLALDFAEAETAPKKSL